MAGDDHFLSRWSRLKHRSRTEAPAAEPPSGVSPAPLSGAAAAPAEAPATPPPLPDVATLTPESDFTGFMRPEVDPHLRRAALRTLFQDPRFNVMDGLDVYIDDFSKPDPMPPEWLGQLNQMARLGEYREPEPEVPGDDPAADTAAADQPQGDISGHDLPSDTRDAGVSCAEVPQSAAPTRGA